MHFIELLFFSFIFIIKDIRSIVYKSFEGHLALSLQAHNSMSILKHWPKLEITFECEAFFRAIQMA